MPLLHFIEKKASLADFLFGTLNAHHKPAFLTYLCRPLGASLVPHNPPGPGTDLPAAIML
jgi:hypothetical protein